MNQIVKLSKSIIYVIIRAWYCINIRPDLKILTEFVIEQILNMIFR